jgi:hypothetical protein
MATIIRQVALVSEVQSVSMSDLTRASAALQKQAVRDFAPIWDVQATVDAFATLEDVPLGYWPVIIEEDIGFDAAGIHLDKDGQPFALVNVSEGWQLTASHEVLEMLADPFGNRLVAGDSPKPDQGRVEFLMEVCDPSEATEFGYTVNGITMSDFYTPAYFDPVQAPGVRYSFTGAIREPRQVLAGGYLSWHEPVTDHWWQLVFFTETPRFRDLGQLTQKPNESLRAMIDRISTDAATRSMFRDMAPVETASRGFRSLVARPSASKAEMWRSEIGALKGRERTTAPERARSTRRDRDLPPERKAGDAKSRPERSDADYPGLEIRRPPRKGSA